MLTIRILDIEKHRNETTFRPWLNLSDLFRDVGIKFIFVGKRFDLTWVGQASCVAKTSAEHETARFTRDTFKRHLQGNDFCLFDGQDSASLRGIYRAYSTLVEDCGQPPLKFFKTSLYADKSQYNIPSPNGRIYWPQGTSVLNWSLPDTKYLDKVELSGTNWLSTISPNWFKYSGIKKDIDVFAMFSYGLKENYEFGQRTDAGYDRHREFCLNYLDMLPKSLNVKTVKNSGGKVPIEQYYNWMSRAKIVVAPFGYGEIAPRDIEAASVGAVLIKPDMGHIETKPNPYMPNKTYVPVKWDYSDLNEKIINILDNFDTMQEYYVENMRQAYVNGYSSEKLVLRTYNWIKNLEGYGTT